VTLCSLLNSDSLVNFKGNLKGVWIIEDDMEDPDIVIYYAHGMFHLIPLNIRPGSNINRGWLLYGIELFLSRVSPCVAKSPQNIWVS
jgi:hypothetical protein